MPRLPQFFSVFKLVMIRGVASPTLALGTAFQQISVSGVGNSHPLQQNVLLLGQQPQPGYVIPIDLIPFSKTLDCPQMLKYSLFLLLRSAKPAPAPKTHGSGLSGQVNKGIGPYETHPPRGYTTLTHLMRGDIPKTEHHVGPYIL